MPSRKLPPRLVLGPLTNRVYLITRYVVRPGGVIENRGEKVDVTDDVGRVLQELDERGLELRPVKPTTEGSEAT